MLSSSHHRLDLALGTKLTKTNPPAVLAIVGGSLGLHYMTLYVCGEFFLLQYGLYLEYAAPIRYWFHLFFEYVAEALGYSTHAEACDPLPMMSNYAWRLTKRKGTNNTHPL